jgi:hypothetical protein
LKIAIVGDVLGSKDSAKGKGKGHTRETPYMVDNDAITDEIATDKGKGELITDLRPRDTDSLGTAVIGAQSG